MRAIRSGVVGNSILFRRAKCCALSTALGVLTVWVFQLCRAITVEWAGVPILPVAVLPVGSAISGLVSPHGTPFSTIAFVVWIAIGVSGMGATAASLTLGYAVPVTLLMVLSEISAAAVRRHWHGNREP